MAYQLSSGGSDWAWIQVMSIGPAGEPQELPGAPCCVCALPYSTGPLHAPQAATSLPLGSTPSTALLASGSVACHEAGSFRSLWDVVAVPCYAHASHRHRQMHTPCIHLYACACVLVGTCACHVFGTCACHVFWHVCVSCSNARVRVMFLWHMCVSCFYARALEHAFANVLPAARPCMCAP